MYIVVRSEDESLSSLQCLTPRVMRWSDDVWVMDLRPSLAYWRSWARRCEVSVVRVFRYVLRKAFGRPLERAEWGLVSLNPGFQACLAPHPWLGILGVQHMVSLGRDGLMDLHSESGRQWIRQLAWSEWWHCVCRFGELCEVERVSGFNLASFKRFNRRLEMVLPRLKLDRPWDMAILHQQGVRRRYGKWLSVIWEWMLSPETSDVPFVWRPWEPGVEYGNRRCLDYGVGVWDQFDEILVEDLDDVCNQMNAGIYITELRWVLFLDLGDPVEVPVRFRYPHCLVLERGHHRSALSQMQLQFEGRVRDQLKQMDEMRQIVGWSIRASEWMTVPLAQLSLFAELEEDGVDAKLDDLSNVMPVPLVRYRVGGDWVSSVISRSDSGESDDAMIRSLLEIGRFLPVLGRRDLGVMTGLTKWW